MLMIRRAAETLKEEVVRFSKAKADPEFARMLKDRKLGPDAAEIQNQLRKQIRVSIRIRLSSSMYLNNFCS